MQMLTVSFRYDVSEEQFAKDNNPEMARMVANIPDLVWKYWLQNSETKECLGVYHFADKASAQAYAAGPAKKMFEELPGYTLIEVKLYDLLEENSLLPVHRG